MPPVSSMAASEICHFGSKTRPSRPPTTMAIVAITNARTAISRTVASPKPRVRWANGPSTLSGPSVTKNRVKISAGPSIVYVLPSDVE